MPEPAPVEELTNGSTLNGSMIGRRIHIEWRNGSGAETVLGAVEGRLDGIIAGEPIPGAYYDERDAAAGRPIVMLGDGRYYNVDTYKLLD